MKVYNNITEMLADFGVEDLYGIGRAFYKGYDFGPWTSFIDSEGDEHYYEDRPSLDLQLTGLRIGSIVEGSDAEVGPIYLPFPIVEADLDRAFSDLGDEADFYWKRDNIDEYVVHNSDGSVFLGSFEVGDSLVDEQTVYGVSPEHLERIIDHVTSNYIEERESFDLDGLRITRVEKSWYTYM